MTLAMDPRLIAAMLEWQAELGADEFIGDEPLDRFALHQAEIEARATRAAAPQPNRREAELPPPPPKVDPEAEARAVVARATSVEHLAELQEAFEHCELRRGAKFIFADGTLGAKVMIISDAPNADEDRAGGLFVGRMGLMLDQMLGAIGLDRASPDLERAVYLAPVLPWRLPADRAPEPEELAMMLPFLRRHIELATPQVVVLIGNHAAQALLGQRSMAKARGKWTEVMGRPALPILHPSYLMRAPHAKRDTWGDLLSLKAKLSQ